MAKPLSKREIKYFITRYNYPFTESRKSKKWNKRYLRRQRRRFLNNEIHSKRIS